MQRIMREWRERGVFYISEQRLCDQARAIRKNGWLSDLELENIQRIVNAGNNEVNENIEDVEETQTENDIIEIGEGNDHMSDEAGQNIGNLSVNMETLDQETQVIIAQIDEIMIEGRNTVGISFKNVDMKTLNRTTAKVNRVIELIETKSITQTNNLYQSCKSMGSR